MPDEGHAISAVRLAKKHREAGKLSNSDYDRIRRKARKIKRRSDVGGLPDWSVRHVLTHRARNADSIVQRLAGAERGERVEPPPCAVLTWRTTVRVVPPRHGCCNVRLLDGSNSGG